MKRRMKRFDSTPNYTIFADGKEEQTYGQV